MSDLYNKYNKIYKNSIDDTIIKEYSKNYQINNIKDNDIFQKYLSYTPKNDPYTSLQPQSIGGINWGVRPATQGPIAYVQPTSEEIEQVLQALHLVNRLPENMQQQVIEATQEIRYFFDGQIRSLFGATRHFNAIRCLNHPERTNISARFRYSQLAGEEFFGLNRFMTNYPDIADVQWWAVYNGGSWRLDDWNPEGEHLDTGFNGWGTLVGSVLKVNGKVLNPSELMAFYRTLRLRNERGFMSRESFGALQAMARALQTEGQLPGRLDEPLEAAQDLGLVDEHGRALTYAGQSMITRTTATQRKQRQLTETDPAIRRIIVPTILT